MQTIATKKAIASLSSQNHRVRMRSVKIPPASRTKIFSKTKNEVVDKGNDNVEANKEGAMGMKKN